MWKPESDEQFHVDLQGHENYKQIKSLLVSISYKLPLLLRILTPHPTSWKSGRLRFPWKHFSSTKGCSGAAGVAGSTRQGPRTDQRPCRTVCHAHSPKRNPRARAPHQSSRAEQISPSPPPESLRRRLHTPEFNIFFLPPPHQPLCLHLCSLRANRCWCHIVSKKTFDAHITHYN